MPITRILKPTVYSLLTLIWLTSSCSVENETTEQREVVGNDLKLNDTVHEELPTDLVRRIAAFHSKLSEVNTTDLETTH